MEVLKGKSILVGKDPSHGRLLIAIIGIAKNAAIGKENSVPNSVSRCIPNNEVAHARIDIDNNGIITITNLKPQNVTFVNGAEVASKRIDDKSEIQLGKDRYSIRVNIIIDAAKKIVASTNTPKQESTVKIFNISHLEKVWKDYHDGLESLREKQRRVNLIRSGCGIFTMCAMPCCFFLGPIGYALTGIGVVGNIYSFIGLKNDNTGKEQERLTEEFQDNYVCPNPECNKFLGNMTYKLLKRQYSMHCPYCKSEFIETKNG